MNVDCNSVPLVYCVAAAAVAAAVATAVAAVVAATVAAAAELCVVPQSLEHRGQPLWLPTSLYCCLKPVQEKMILCLATCNVRNQYMTLQLMQVLATD